MLASLGSFKGAEKLESNSSTTSFQSQRLSNTYCHAKREIVIEILSHFSLLPALLVT
jgi:hypothetical protein